MDKSKLTGDLPELYAQRYTRRVNLGGGVKYFEYVESICSSWAQDGAQHLELRALGLSGYGFICKGIKAGRAWRWYPTPMSRAEFERLYMLPQSIYNL